MEKGTRDKDALIDAILKLDAAYQEKLKECAELEKRFDKMIAQLSPEQQNLAWDFVMQCEDMSQYALALACKHMEFRDIPKDWVAFSDKYEQRMIEAEKVARILLDGNSGL